MSDAKDEMKERILEATIRWKLEHPFLEPQLTQLAAMAGVSLRTLSRYYPNKEDLLGLAAMRYMSRKNEEHAKTIASIREGSGTAAEQIRSFFCSQRAAFRQDPAMIRIYATANMRCVDYALRHQMRLDVTAFSVKEALLSLLESGKRDGSVRPDLDSEMTVALMTTGFNGLMQQIAMTYTSMPTEREIEDAAMLYKEFLKMVEWYVLPKK